MKDLSFYEKRFFIPALFISVLIHGFLISASGWISAAPSASVVRAPSSLEITVLRQPVVSVLAKEIVSEAIVERENLDQAVFGDRFTKPAFEPPIPAAVPSRESRGAMTEAEPLAPMNPAPPYPRIARQRGWEGIVRLDVFVGKDGIPGEVRVAESSGHEVLDKAAARTVAQWKFSPARSGSIRFSSRMTIPIQFTLVSE